MPLSHPPGHAQVDFGEAVGVIGGVRQKIHFFCMDLPQSYGRNWVMGPEKAAYRGGCSKPARTSRRSDTP